MVSVLEAAQPKVKEVGERIEKASVEEHARDIKALSPDLFKKIQGGTLTLNEVDSYLHKNPEMPLELRQYLLGKKAWLMVRDGKGEQALHFYDEALEINEESPSPWAAKGMALLELERVDEAFQAFQKAYLLRENFGGQKQGHLENLFNAWSVSALLLGLTGILEQNSRLLQKGVEEYLAILEKAGAENLKHAVLNLQFQGSVTQEIRDAVEELILAVRLLSIKDPFEGFRALSKEISKVWPAGLSAVDAIREQRDREWNQ